MKYYQTILILLCCRDNQCYKPLSQDGFVMSDNRTAESAGVTKLLTFSVYDDTSSVIIFN